MSNFNPRDENQARENVVFYRRRLTKWVNRPGDHRERVEAARRNLDKARRDLYTFTRDVNDLPASCEENR